MLNKEKIEEIQRIQQEMMLIAGDNEDLVRNIVENVLLLGKRKVVNGYYITLQDVYKIIEDSYPPCSEKTSDLKMLTYELFLVKSCEFLFTESWDHTKKYKRSDNFEKFCVEVEEEIIKIFYPGDLEDNMSNKLEECGIIGDIIE